MELIIRVKVVNDKSFADYFSKKFNNLFIFMLSCTHKFYLETYYKTSSKCAK